MATEPRTLCELFQQGLARSRRDPAFLHKIEGVYRPISSQEFADRVSAVASGLATLGVRPGDRVAILSENRIEWAIADWAILHVGAVSVPLYATLTPATVEALLTDSGAVAAFVSNRSQIAKLGAPGALPRLAHIIAFEGESDSSDPQRPVLALRELDARGLARLEPEAFERGWRAVRPQDLATIVYTSGTSGASKGVMLTHANLVANILAALRRFAIGPTDTCLSFLPLSHVLERSCGHFLMWHAGATVAYAENVEAVAQNLAEVHPTVLISVPRLYEKMNARILAAVAQSPPLRRRLFAWAQKVGAERVRLEQSDKPVPAGLRLQSRLADRLVFQKLRARVGGRMRLLVSGGAPLSRSIAEFFYAAGLPIIEGYGLTETSPILAVNPQDRPRIGTVGPPLDNVELRIGPDGEILARGPSVMQGYWNNMEATDEALRGGWFHTGDVGEIDKDGYLRITDRLKDLIVTAGGKKVAPQPLEARLKGFPYLAEAILIGDGRKYVAALVIPNFVNLEAWARAQSVSFGSRAELVQAPAVLEAFSVYIGSLNQDLAPFERIKRFRLLERELEHDAGELTPSMKVRRTVISKTFAALIDELYIDPPGPGVGTAPAAPSDSVESPSRSTVA